MVSDALSVGQIARRNAAAEHQVRYIVDTRGIEPCWRSANCRLFDEQAQQQIAAALASIRSKRRASR